MNLRQLFETKDLTLIAGVYDALSAIIAQQSGFHAVWVSGLSVSASKGVPDMSILTMSDILRESIMINDAVSIPVIVDCDSGFGDIHNVHYLVKKFEKAGVGGVCIEDKKFPKTNSFIEKGNSVKQIKEIKEFGSLIRAAKLAQQGEDFQLIARIESFICGVGLEDALERARFYEKCGADVILIHSKKDTHVEVERFMKSYEGKSPVIAIPTTYSNVSFSELTNLNISAAIYANQAIRGVTRKLQGVFKAIIQDHSSKNIESDISGLKEIFSLQRIHQYQELESRAKEELLALKQKS